MSQPAGHEDIIVSKISDLKNLLSDEKIDKNVKNESVELGSKLSQENLKNENDPKKDLHLENERLKKENARLNKFVITVEKALQQYRSEDNKDHHEEEVRSFSKNFVDEIVQKAEKRANDEKIDFPLKHIKLEIPSDKIETSKRLSSDDSTKKESKISESNSHLEKKASEENLTNVSNQEKNNEISSQENIFNEILTEKKIDQKEHDIKSISSSSKTTEQKQLSNEDLIELNDEYKNEKHLETSENFETIPDLCSNNKPVPVISSENLLSKVSNIVNELNFGSPSKNEKLNSEKVDSTSIPSFDEEEPKNEKTTSKSSLIRQIENEMLKPLKIPSKSTLFQSDGKENSKKCLNPDKSDEKETENDHEKNEPILSDLTLGEPKEKETLEIKDPKKNSSYDDSIKAEDDDNEALEMHDYESLNNLVDRYLNTEVKKVIMDMLVEVMKHPIEKREK